MTDPAAADTTAPRTSRRNRVAILLLLLAGLLAAAYYAVHWWTEGRFIESTDNAYLAVDSVTVAPKIAGYVSHVAIVENAPVGRGALLVQIDAAPFQARVLEMQANVASRTADIERLQAEIRAQTAAVQEARTRTRLARSTVALAQANARRYAQLAKSGYGSQQRLEESQSAQDQALAQVDTSLAAVHTAEAQLGVLRAQVRQAHTAIDSARAQMHAARIDLDATDLRAAIAGRIGDLTVRRGQYVQAGTRLMTVVPTDAVYLEANFKETQLGRMRTGQKVRVHIDALPDADIEGRIESLAPGTGSTFALLPPENATGNFIKIVQRVPVRIGLTLTPEQKARLAPGLSAVAKVDTRTGAQ